MRIYKSAAFSHFDYLFIDGRNRHETAVAPGAIARMKYDCPLAGVVVYAVFKAVDPHAVSKPALIGGKNTFLTLQWT